ncbi:TIGR00730 family Rossman fold protein [Flavobacteriaceae bacterium F89]|uniref:Cytokinin riboside 5'-monophosphate phosphoribohydrolase n=1 Tax=Cerina litoralis TaxID=2874477 RepID=A0AAE3JPS7_9FLAO|nr:TIGR00730 family Rossman fold protein [Cerina litoralis]MCG2461099.1 TIGR00730 family Rossman fold protein [Cerina litoralis]
MDCIVVFCGSSEGKDPTVIQTAYNLGAALANRHIRLVYGAAKIGIMGKVAQGVLDNRGEVIGVVPQFLIDKEIIHEGLSRLIITENMHQRKLKMHELSDGVIALPGGFGTMEELFEMITWAQLGLHRYPIGILNINGFYDDLLKMLRKMVSEGFLKPENHNLLLVDNAIDGLLRQMKDYKPSFLPKWISKGQT